MTRMRCVRDASLSAVCTCVAALAATSAAQAMDMKVSIDGTHFKPPQLTAEVGDTVTWVNEGFLLHTVTADNGDFDSGTIRAGGRFLMTFTKPGTFDYSCTIHPEMHGSVTVTGHAAGGEHPEHGEHGTAPPPPTTDARGTARVSLRLGRGRRAHRRVTHVAISSSRPGGQVVLQLYSREHFAWLQVAHATLDANGAAVFSLRARVHRQVRAVVLGMPGEGPSISAPLRT